MLETYDQMYSILKYIHSLQGQVIKIRIIISLILIRILQLNPNLTWSSEQTC